MAQTKVKKIAIAAGILLFGGAAAVMVQQTLTRSGTTKNSGAQTTKISIAAQAQVAAPATNASPEKFLVFRNRPSWNRQPDFEDVLLDLGLDFEVKPAELMATTDLSRYRAIIIPGAQSTRQFYPEYIQNAVRFDDYVTNGGTLLLELNGAESSGLLMPRGVRMVMNPARDNLITLQDHPVVLPLAGRPIRANYASHGYLSDVPADATVLATEAMEGEALPDKPTFVEYRVGQGRVIAACQCFHDRDNSGRGPLMQTVLSYANEKKWYAPEK